LKEACERGLDAALDVGKRLSEMALQESEEKKKGSEGGGGRNSQVNKGSKKNEVERKGRALKAGGKIHSILRVPMDRKTPRESDSGKKK